MTQANNAQTERGYEEPFAVQFSLFLSNRVGQLADLLDLVSVKELAVMGVSIVDSTDWAVIRIVLGDSGKAREVFKARAIPFTESPVLLVCIGPDSTLAAACAILTGAEINVHFAYPLTIRHDDQPVMVFHVDDAVVATRTLTKHGFVLLGEEDMNDPR